MGDDPASVYIFANGSSGRGQDRASLDTILTTLGAPDGYKSIKQYYAKLPRFRHYHSDLGPETAWYHAHYGTLEVLFLEKTDEVVFFKVYFREDEPHSLPACLDDGWMPLVDHISRAELNSLLTANSIPYQDVSFHPDVYQVCLPQSCLSINVNLEDGDDSLIVIATQWGQKTPCLCP